MNKYLINLRGASASGKTTALKQFCDRSGFVVEKVSTPFGDLPVSVLRSGIIVLGDYSLDANCLGADRFNGGTQDIIDCLIAVYEQYNPNIIIYEHMLSSLSFRGTNIIAGLAHEFGYEFFAIQLQLSESKRWQNLMQRSGSEAKSKNFDRNNGERVTIACEKLKKAGIEVIQIDVQNIKKENMWKVVEYGIRKKVK